MSGALESLGLDDISMTFLRHFLISIYGHIREREVFEQIQSSVRGRVDAVDFVEKLNDNSHIYVSIINPSHTRWNSLPPAIRKTIGTINSLRVVMIRPLMLAVARDLPPSEAGKAFRLLLSCTVRFLIVGGGRSGSIEETYAEIARNIYKGEIKNAKGLSGALNAVVPTDERFRAEFATARVSQNYLARYYLRALEDTLKEQDEPELIPNDDPAINLEHILPQTPEADWSHVLPEMAAAYCKRIGNMVLLPSKINSTIGNQSFAVKKSAFSNSGLELTKMVATESAWGVDQIAKRQEFLASLAVKTWPLKVR